MTTYLFTRDDRRKAHSAEARAKRLETVEERRRYQREDVLLLRRRGLVPLAISDELGISLRRVMEYLAGESVPGYLITWGEPPREPKLCRHCGRG